MLYADDLVLLAVRTRFTNSDEQSQNLRQYFPNASKPKKMTKVLIFDKSAKLIKRTSRTWTIGDVNIEEDRVFLGAIFTRDRSFIGLVNTLKEKGNKAYYSIIAKSKEWQGFNPKAFFHIFIHTILPILNYGAEVCRGKDWTELEKLHLSACKYILGVSHSAPTDGIQFRLGVHDLEIERGQYGRKPLLIEERLCKLCLGMRIRAVEYEIHFLLHCSYYAKQRQRRFEKLTQMHNDLHLLEIQQSSFGYYLPPPKKKKQQQTNNKTITVSTGWAILFFLQ